MTLKEIIDLASNQFKIKNAKQRIRPSSELFEVFTPRSHGPQNVPIWVEDVDHGDNFTHFPIVNSCISYLFLPYEKDYVEVFDMYYNGPARKYPNFWPIELEEIDESELKGSGFKQGFKTKSTVIFNQSDPQPIAIQFSVRHYDTDFILKYIVVSEDVSPRAPGFE